MTTTLSDITGIAGIITPILAVVGLVVTSARSGARTDARLTDVEARLSKSEHRQDAQDAQLAAVKQTLADIDKNACLIAAKVDSNAEINKLSFENLAHSMKNLSMALKGIGRVGPDDRSGD